MGATWTQFFPPKPTFREADVPSQAGKVFVVTGANTGIGLELARILYSKSGTVYLTGRSEKKITSAIEQIETDVKNTSTAGRLKSLVFDLSDLTTIPTAAKTILDQETRLDVIFNNAGIAHVPAGSTSAQGYEAHMGTNCLGPFLFTKLLLPLLGATARTVPAGSVRIVWASSSIIDVAAHPGGLILDELDPSRHGQVPAKNYASSKSGNWFLASELDKRLRDLGIVSITQNPGNLRTNSFNNVPIQKAILYPFLQVPKFGAYTNLWCGLSDEVKLEDGGRYAIPWGRWHPGPRADILESLKTKDEGGTGVAAAFYDWCEKQMESHGFTSQSRVLS